MATTTIQSNNKFVHYDKRHIGEYIQPNMFKGHMGDSLDSVIVNYYDKKDGGDQVNVPLYRALRGAGVGAETLVNNEEKQPNYGMRVWCDWKRNGVLMSKDEMRKQSADFYGLRRKSLKTWLDEQIYQDIASAYLALPSESAPTGIGQAPGATVNGILYEAASASQRNTWNANNSDRVLYGNDTANYNATHATALANIDTTNDTFVEDSVISLEKIALLADPSFSPYRTEDGYESNVCYAGTNLFLSLRKSMGNRWQYSMERGLSNPLYKPGDIIVNGTIVRHVPAISKMVTSTWTSLKTAGASSARVEPVFLCGQSSLVRAMVSPLAYAMRKEDDYEFHKGLAIEACYGFAKVFDQDPVTTTKLVQRNVVTGFFTYS